MKKILLTILCFISVNIYAQTWNLIKDINPNGSSYPSRFTEFNGKVYFFANDGENGKELWVTDGTSMVKEFLLRLTQMKMWK